MNHRSLDVPCQRCGSKIPRPRGVGKLRRHTVHCPGCHASVTLDEGYAGSSNLDIDDLVEKLGRDLDERARTTER